MAADDGYDRALRCAGQARCGKDSLNGLNLIVSGASEMMIAERQRMFRESRVYARTMLRSEVTRSC